eukprot:9923472-Alexandrium_andersonii.AAC.1
MIQTIACAASSGRTTTARGRSATPVAKSESAMGWGCPSTDGRGLRSTAVPRSGAQSGSWPDTG